MLRVSKCFVILISLCELRQYCFVHVHFCSQRRFAFSINYRIIVPLISIVFQKTQELM